MKRRTFIKKGTVGSAALLYPFYISGNAREKKIKIGLIGSGWYGMVITKAALQIGGVEIIGVCDVDSQHLNSSADEIENLQGKRPKTFKYYEDLLNMKDIEAVMIGTVPHWHALQFIAACEKGLDIYCEKPLAYDVKEGSAMVKAAEKAGNIIQVGFQRRQSEAFKKTKELIDEGKIGKVHQIGAQIHYNPILEDTTIQPPPEPLDWDEWCGPAPKLDYRPNIGHKAWRLEKEYGNGHLVDWGIHHIDIIRKIMGLDIPERFVTTGGINVLNGKITTPDTLVSTMHFPQAPVVWEHRLWGSGDLHSGFKNGIYFYGDKGTLFAADRRVVIMMAGRDQELQQMDIPTQGMQEKHVADWLNAVREKDKNLISCTVDDAFKSTSTVQLAMISYYTDSEVIWDNKMNSIKTNPEAESLLAREYRKGYDRPVL